MTSTQLRDDRPTWCTQCEREWPDNQTIVGLSREILVNHYERRDLDAVMRAMVDDLTWIGPMEGQHARSAADMLRIIEPEYGTRVSLVDEDWGVRTAGGARIVIGRYGAVAEGTDVEDVVFRQSATFVWVLTPRGPRVVHLHVSNSYDVPARVDQPFVPGEDGVAYAIDAVGPLATSKRQRIRFEVPDIEVCFVAEDRIVRLEAEERGSLVAYDGGILHCNERLAQLEERLPAWFVRTHRRCIANAHRAVGVRRFAVVMDDGSECPIAERRYLEIAEAVQQAAEHLLESD